MSTRGTLTKNNRVVEVEFFGDMGYREKAFGLYFVARNLDQWIDDDRISVNYNPRLDGGSAFTIDGMTLSYKVPSEASASLAKLHGLGFDFNIDADVEIEEEET